MIFTFILTVFAVFWIWEFINEYIPLPGWASYIIVGLTAYGLLHVAMIYLAAMAAAAIVGLLHRIVARPDVQVPVRNKRSSLPPLP